MVLATLKELGSWVDSILQISNGKKDMKWPSLDNKVNPGHTVVSLVLR